MKSLPKSSVLLLALIFLFSGCAKQNRTQTAVTSEPTPSTIATEPPIVTVNEEYPPMPVSDTSKIDDKYRTYYEIFLYSFYDSNGDGIGDLKGLTSKLDYLNDNDPTTDTDLGITGIWLMPIMPSKSYHKYDVKDYYNIDPDYGTLDDFKELMKECHSRNINVIIDFVFNHTSDEHPWFQDAVTYIKGLSDGEEPNPAECKYFDYYNFTKEKSSNKAYHQIAGTDWYYEGQFSVDMPDLNLSNREVRKEIEQAADFWLELGVDGFRLDAAKEYFTGASTKNIEVLNWFSSYIYSEKPEAYLVAEVWDTFGTIVSYYESGIDSIFNYAFGNSDGKLAITVNNAGNGKAGITLAKNMKQVQETFLKKNPNAIDACFLSNHDNNRASSYVGYDEQLVKMLGGLNLMMNGNSFIYYGEELGMVGTGKDENKRIPMYWSKLDGTGMTSGPASMEKQAQKFPAADEQDQDDSSILCYYKRAIRLRNEFPEIARGSIDVIEGIDPDITSVKKTYNNSSIILLMNISDQEKQVTLPKNQYSYQKIGGVLTVTSTQPDQQEEQLTLPPYAIVILK